MWSAVTRGPITRTVLGVCSKATTGASVVAIARTSVVGTTSTLSHLTTRPFSSYSPSPLDAFRDTVDRETRSTQMVGRSWSVHELRRKSYEDLHKLWYVLYMERNMLLTERQLSRRRKIVFPQPQRLMKVRKSMGAIKHVLGERKRKKIAEHHANADQLEVAMDSEADAMEDMDLDENKGDEKKER